MEELSRACLGVSTSYAANALGTFPLLLYGTEEQKKKYLPDIASGQAGRLRPDRSQCRKRRLRHQTTAELDGNDIAERHQAVDHQRRRGRDLYGYRHYRPQQGPPRRHRLCRGEGHPGFDFGKKESKMGIRASATRELVFNHCRIPKEPLGREGMGFIVAMKTLDQSRPGVGAQGVGMAQGALDEAVQYARNRVQFGKPIISFQAIQHMLADMATQTEAARALVYAAARYIDSGAKDFPRYPPWPRSSPRDVAMKVTTDAVQVLGGSGYMREYPVEKMMRDAKILQIFEGTNQIQRNVIGQEMNKEAAEAKGKSKAQGSGS